ncbi:MAG: hypothetical protein CL526_06285 [Aequorivita sp.]|nr:hypothetical protein [Aequorivita sp.]|tara:strand:+ start:60797 stop:61489 length:693 start_codon:yes stop_codon:yes gene_type:complete
MKIKVLLFFFGIVFCVSTGYSQSEINQVDAEGKRHGLWKKTFAGSTQLRYEGTFKHGKEVGEFKFYCEECKDQPMVIKKFSSKDNTAHVSYFTKKGKLVSEGKMAGKERIGEWVYYHKGSNNIMTREHYTSGKLDGKMTTYYPNGTITEVINYKDGKKEGENSYFSPEGILLKKLNYKNDVLHGSATYYDAYGNVIIEGAYKNNKKHGLWKYYKDGKTVLEETFPKPKNK